MCTAAQRSIIGTVLGVSKCDPGDWAGWSFEAAKVLWLWCAVVASTDIIMSRHTGFPLCVIPLPYFETQLVRLHCTIGVSILTKMVLAVLMKGQSFNYSAISAAEASLAIIDAVRTTHLLRGEDVQITV